MTRSSSCLISFLTISLFFTTCFSFPKLHVTITNTLPGPDPPLILHCKSKDNDLGIHTVLLNQSYDWSFRMNLIGSTLFSCDFVWGKQHAGFVVFSKDIAKKLHNGEFMYQARGDGFYFNVNGDWQKVQDWSWSY
ncbi:hypothetical protein DCAR_0935752 [Daucus carota subsp. sativus]|uniref:S-protein homolog n=1 Tax=Daucus carota subsp. sativus TaxID=79200 RepID=A0AAF0XXU4_DAUCS|nr:hypothetical protein DCAR_0935752 [Daucus carota subsp. sativus]